jgi:hypothetical protein
VYGSNRRIDFTVRGWRKQGEKAFNNSSNGNERFQSCVVLPQMYHFGFAVGKVVEKM